MTISLPMTMTMPIAIMKVVQHKRQGQNSVPIIIIMRKRKNCFSSNNNVLLQLLLMVVLLLFHYDYYYDSWMNSISNSNSNTYMSLVLLYTHAYTTGAGACPYNQSAVRGSHIDDNSNNKIIVRRGQSLHRLGIELRINNKVIHTNTTSIFDPNIDYMIELIATGISATDPTMSMAKALNDNEYIVPSFRGALIRMEMTRGNNIFDFKPYIDTTTGTNNDTTNTDTDTTIALKCTLPAVGITHSSNVDRTSMKGIVTFQSYGTVHIDVTVVVVNNNKTSNFAYSSFPTIKVRKLNTTTSTNSNTPMMSSYVKTFKPSITQQPSTTVSPSYSERCYLCTDSITGSLNENYIVQNKDTSFEFVNVITTCGELEYTAVTQSLPPILCDVAKEAVFTHNCNCILPPDDSTVITNTDSTPVVAVAPAAVPVPIVTTIPPTYENKCYICNGNTQQVVTNLNATVTLPSYTTGGSSSSNTDTSTTSALAIDNNSITQISCDRLQRAALSGRISPSLCTAFLSINVASTCGCTGSTDSTTTTNSTGTVPTVPTPSISTGTSTGLTFAPSITRKPSISKAPHYISTQICYGCGQQQLTIIDNKKIVTYLGYQYTCGQLYNVQGRISNLDITSCTNYQQTIQQQCGCTTNPNTNTNTNPAINLIPSPSVSIQTFIPTITISPTITQMPSYTDLCYICGNDDERMYVTNPNDNVIVKGKVYTCEKIFYGGINGHIPPLVCQYFVEAALYDCNCQVGTVPINKNPNQQNQNQQSSSLSSSPLLVVVSLFNTNVTVYTIFNSLVLLLSFGVHFL